MYNKVIQFAKTISTITIKYGNSFIPSCVVELFMHCSCLSNSSVIKTRCRRRSVPEDGREDSLLYSAGLLNSYSDGLPEGNMTTHGRVNVQGHSHSVCPLTSDSRSKRARTISGHLAQWLSLRLRGCTGFHKNHHQKCLTNNKLLGMFFVSSY